jgi:hypothetical protein
MSSSRTYNTPATPATPATATPYCKVCRDAGKTEKEYNSHFVKDQPGPNGKVVCPTLLNQSCRICGKTGHTSSYCSQYRNRQVREEPRREPRREERYIEREPRREERRDCYIEREPRRDDRRVCYIEREPRRDDRRDISYNRLHEDTERHEREVRERDEQYQREQERRSKPWLQAAMKPSAPREQQQQRREPYAHPHGPRVRLNLETTALCASKHAAPAAAPAIDVRKVELHHAAKWGDEDIEIPFVCDPEQMTRKFFEEEIMAGLTTKEEFDFIAICDDQSQLPFECGE